MAHGGGGRKKCPTPCKKGGGIVLAGKCPGEHIQGEMSGSRSDYSSRTVQSLHVLQINRATYNEELTCKPGRRRPLGAKPCVSHRARPPGATPHLEILIRCDKAIRQKRRDKEICPTSQSKDIVFVPGCRLRCFTSAFLLYRDHNDGNIRPRGIISYLTVTLYIGRRMVTTCDICIMFNICDSFIHAVD